MARTVFPVQSKSGWLTVTASSTSPPSDRTLQRPLRATRNKTVDGGSPNSTPLEDKQTYLERVQNYIPSEIVAMFVLVNSLIVSPMSETGRMTAEGYVAIASVVVCLAACFILARVAAKQVDNPAYRTQGLMFAIALLIWIYAIDAKVLEVMEITPIPALSGLLLVTFTVFSGLVVPTVKFVSVSNQETDGGDGSAAKNSSLEEVPSTDLADGGSTLTARGETIMSDNQSHYCICMRNRPGAQPIAGSERAAVLREAKWAPGTRISVHFLSGSDALKQRVRDAAEEWVGDGMANLSFRWVDDEAADIRIAFAQGDGSWSYLGTVCRQIPAPEPTMNYGWLTDGSSDAEVRDVVLHEFGHALGLIHEHQNPKGGIVWNEAAVIADLSGPPNNWDLDTIRRNVLDKYTPDTIAESTEVDEKSIMMYPIPASWTDGSFSAGMNGDLSELDKRLIREAYP